MLPVLFALALAGFQLKATTSRADWHVSETKLKVDTGACEAFLAKTELKLGVNVPHFRYRRVKTALEVSRVANVYAGGTVFFNKDEGVWEVISTQPCSKHEIVHLVTLQIGRADPVFEEGIASMLAGDTSWIDRQNVKNDIRYWWLRPVTYTNLDEMLQMQSGSIDERWRQYLLADGWVRHLVRHHGLSTLTLFFRASAAGKSAREAFRLSYGATLDDAFEYWLYGTKGPPKPPEARQQ